MHGIQEFFDDLNKGIFNNPEVKEKTYSTRDINLGSNKRKTGTGISTQKAEKLREILKRKG